MKHCFLLLFLLLEISSINAQTEKNYSLLKQLDKVIEKRTHYEEAKKQRIINIKKSYIPQNSSSKACYIINDLLFQEYESYICDSALYYINENIRIANEQKNQDWINVSKLNKAHILATSGLYVEASDLLHSIQKKTLNPEELINYYMTFENLYLYQAEYTQGDSYMYKYLNKRNQYRDSVLNIVPENSYNFVITKVPELIDHNLLKQAEDLLFSYLPQVETNTRNYAVITSIMAFLYQCSGQVELQKEYLTKSAIADTKAVVKENNSLRALSEILYEEGQIERADLYVKVSMEDANIYNARLRNVQAAKMLPIIDKVYQSEKERQARILRWQLGIISMLTLFLIIAIIYVILQMKKLARANERQKQTNHSLSEANCIKEEYIGRFLSLCSTYIDKLESYRRMLNKKAASGKTEELYNTLKSTQLIDNELKEFYQNFDNSFLNIFPDFVSDFNRLLPENERIHPKQDERLTTELRIFALIRLGITDSSKIANFLHYSITTIYTYRSKLKNKSLYKDQFEERIMEIGSFNEWKENKK